MYPDHPRVSTELGLQDTACAWLKEQRLRCCRSSGKPCKITNRTLLCGSGGRYSKKVGLRLRKCFCNEPRIDLASQRQSLWNFRSCNHPGQDGSLMNDSYCLVMLPVLDCPWRSSDNESAGHTLEPPQLQPAKSSRLFSHRCVSFSACSGLMHLVGRLRAISHPKCACPAGSFKKYNTNLIN